MVTSGFFFLLLLSLCVLSSTSKKTDKKNHEHEPDKKNDKNEEENKKNEKVEVDPVYLKTFHDFKYPKDLVKAIDKCMNYILGVIHKNGTFQYETIGNSAKPKLPIKYNSVRHAGTIWSLTLYIKYKFYKDHDLVPEVREAAVKTTKHLLSLIESPNDGKKTYSSFKGMLTTNVTEMDKTHEPVFALGGSALALVTLSSMEELQLLKVDKEILRGIGRFILNFMDSKGDFSQHYFYQGKGKTDNRTCVYYPGEAALALIKLYVVDPDIKWLEAARDILEVLAKKHLKERLELVDHWYLIASQHIFQYQKIIKLPKDLIFAAAVKFANFAIDYPRENWCGSNAIFEGLTAACLLFKYEFSLGHTYDGKYDGLLEYVTPHLIDGTQKLIACQGGSGGIARGLHKLHNDKYVVRIDDNQHTVSTWMRTYEFLYQGYDAKY